MALTMMRDPLFADFRLMDDLFGRMFGNVNRVAGFIPTLDVRETEDEYLVLVDLPGVKSEDVVIELTDQVLTISGSRTPVETGEVRRSERPSGSFVRRLTLPKWSGSEVRARIRRRGSLAGWCRSWRGACGGRGG
jgi:HSP20 family protein